MKTHAGEKAGVGHVVGLACVAALGGVLFGYDTAVISGAIGYLEDHFHLTPALKGWAGSSVLVGCIVGAAGAGWLGDRLGRKRVMILCAVLFALSAIGSALPRTLTELVLARILGGFAVGATSLLSPLYIAEISPARLRGRLVSLNQLAIIGGMLVVYWVNSWIAASASEAWNVEEGWRWMLGSETLPALLFLALLVLVPESPRWLVRQGREEEAEAILSRIDGPERARASIAEVRELLAEGEASLGELLRPGPRTALWIALALAVLQQVTGINVVIYYAPEIFKLSGTGAAEAIGDTVPIGIVNVLFTLIAIRLVDRSGRRPLLLVTSAGMGLSLCLLASAFAIGAPASWILAFTLAYVASFAVAMGPVVWVVLAEIFPTRARGAAMSIATFALWVSCFAVAQTAPSLLAPEGGIGPVWTFGFYAAMCFVAFLFVLRFVPETKGKTLEEIERGWRAEEG